MYIYFGIFLAFAFISTIVFHFRRKSIIWKICSMCSCEKFDLLNELIEPFGFEYELGEDIFTSRLHAPQRNFGYTALDDTFAVYFNIVFDCDPIYFNYQNRTWLIELWKGQYGINIGAEVGIYHADKTISPSERPFTLFECADEDELMDISIELFHRRHPLFAIKEKHWWMTGFVMGLFGYPQDLSAKISIIFPDMEMQTAFVHALAAGGYSEQDYYTYDTAVYLEFNTPYAKCPCPRQRMAAWLSQLENRIFCRMYKFFTRPFIQTMDRLLFLYFHFPFAFRHMCKIHIHKRRRKKRRWKR